MPIIQISTKELDMSHHNLYSEFVSAIQDEVFMISVFIKTFSTQKIYRTSYPSSNPPYKTYSPITIII